MNIAIQILRSQNGQSSRGQGQAGRGQGQAGRGQGQAGRGQGQGGRGQGQSGGNGAADKEAMDIPKGGIDFSGCEQDEETG